MPRSLWVAVVLVVVAGACAREEAASDGTDCPDGTHACNDSLICTSGRCVAGGAEGGASGASSSATNGGDASGAAGRGGDGGAGGAPAPVGAGGDAQLPGGASAAGSGALLAGAPSEGGAAGAEAAGGVAGATVRDCPAGVPLRAESCALPSSVECSYATASLACVCAEGQWDCALLAGTGGADAGAGGASASLGGTGGGAGGDAFCSTVPLPQANTPDAVAAALCWGAGTPYLECGPAADASRVHCDTPYFWYEIEWYDVEGVPFGDIYQGVSPREPGTLVGLILRGPDGVYRLDTPEGTTELGYCTITSDAVTNCIW